MRRPLLPNKLELPPKMIRSPHQAARLPGGLWPCIVFCLALLLFFVLSPRFAAELDPPTGDEPFYLQMAISLVRDHDLEMSNNYAQADYREFYPIDTTSTRFSGWDAFPADLPPHQSTTLVPGLFEKHGAGLAALIAPAYQLGGRLGTVTLMNLLAALLAANMFLLAREFTGDLKASLITALGLSLTSPLLPYSFLIFPAIPAALMAIYAFRRARLSPRNNNWQFAGVALSLAVLPWLHAGYLLLSIPLFALFVARNWDGRKRLGIFAIPLTVSAAGFLIYYYYLYGTIIPNYGDHAGFSIPFGTVVGLLGLLLDQQWGLLTYAPFYLVGLAGIVVLARRQRGEFLALALATVPTLLFFSSYRQWWGEWCPPARYLVPILPFAAAPAAMVLGQVQRSGKYLSRAFLAVSVLIMSGFVFAPKLMYNHPTGESQLFLSLAGSWGLDLTKWMPSFVVSAPEAIWRVPLAIVVAASLVGLLVAFSTRNETRTQPPLGINRLRRWLVPRRYQVIIAVALGITLVVGAYFRFMNLNWDSGQHLHPDERFITMVGVDTSLPSSIGQYFDSSSSPLNPINRNQQAYPYGTSFLFLAKFLAGPLGMDSYDKFVLLGRFLSALADLGTVLLLFFLGRRLYNRWVGLAAAFLYAVAVLPVQHAHFFVSESFTAFFLVLTMLFAVRIPGSGKWYHYLGMGIACGLALGSKVSVAPVMAVMALAALMAYRARGGLQPVFGLALSVIATVLVFRAVQPYAFMGNSFLDFRPSNIFWGNVEVQRRMAEGSLEFPYTLQWAGTTRYTFFIQNFFWGLGPLLTGTAIAGAGLAIYQLARWRRLEHLLVLAWVGIAFLYFGGQSVKYMRYLLPIYPFMALIAAFLLVWLAGRLRDRIPAKKTRATAAALALAIVLLGSFLWAWAYTRIYTHPVTRIEASEWIYQNVPAGAAVAVEHWDDPLPLSLPAGNAQKYRIVTLELYNDDTPAKVNTIVNQLSQVDYIFISSNRLYDSIPRLPLRYPMTSAYYRLLFSGQLGFQQVRVFTSYPQLGQFQLVDDDADESFTVYDHPKVLIFKKTEAFAPDRARQLLSAVPLDNVVRQGVKDASSSALLMAPDLAQANRSGGTWTEIFNAQGLPSRFPFLSWYLLVQFLSLAALPVGLLGLGRLPDRGYPLLKALGVLMVTYLAWLAASLRLAPHTQATITAGIALVALVSALVFWKRRQEVGQTLRDNWKLILATELLFLTAFAAFYFIRMANPDLWHPYRGGEKPMDLAFLNAVARSTYFPPYDPWLSGGYINYYYFGQLVVATLSKLTGIATTTSYNLAVPLFFALTMLGAFSAGYNLLAGSRLRMSWRSVLAGGLMAALFVAVMGNLDGLVQLIQGFWQVNPHPFESSLPGVSGLVNGILGMGQTLGGKPLPAFDFWRSTRVMVPTFSITEFPFFSFLFADLHAHLVALPYTLLALGFILGLARGRLEFGFAGIARLALTCLSLGALWVINSWDFPTYFLLTALGLFFIQLRRRFTWPGMGKTALLAGGIFVGSYLLFFPFHHYYQQFYAGVSPSPEKTPLHQYLEVHGLFILIIGAYMLARLRDGIKRLPGGVEVLVPGVVLIAGLFTILLLLQLHTAAFLVLLLGLAGLMLAAARDRSSILVAVMIVVALALGLGVEFVTIQGDIQRMNTVFKFYLQAWVLMGVASAYCLAILLRGWHRRGRPWYGYAWGALVAIAIWATLLYPMNATPVRTADRFNPLPPTDDGMAYMQGAVYADEKGKLDLSLDYRAIRWLQQNIKGSPVILEGNTPLYRWGSRISIYTGLPTVIGWDWHEKQQRAAYTQMVDTRLADVQTMYSTTDSSALLNLLRKYQVSYIYVGELERAYYPPQGIAKFQTLDGSAMLHSVYEDGPVTIYEVLPP